MKGRRIIVDGSRWGLPDVEMYIGVVLSRTKYISDSTKKEIDGYEVKWLLDDVRECITYREVLDGVKDYEEWCSEGVCMTENDINDVDVIDSRVVEVDVDVIDDDHLQDHCRELMMRGECDEQYHSDDESFVIGGDGDQKTL